MRNLPTLTFPGGQEPTDSGRMLIGDKGRLYAPGDFGDVQRLEVKGPVQTPEPTIERLRSEVNALAKCINIACIIRVGRFFAFLRPTRRYPCLGSHLRPHRQRGDRTRLPHAVFQSWRMRQP